MKKTEENSLLITFARPYLFEGKEYTQIDLSRLGSLTTGQLYELNKRFAVEQYISPRPEADLSYCCMVAAEVARLPQEFFDDLPAREGVKVKNEVMKFFLQEESVVSTPPACEN